MKNTNIQQLILNNQYKKLIAGNLIIRRDDPDNLIYCGGTRSHMTLYTAIQDIQDGILKFPPHQRDYCWSESKTKEYAITLSSDACPPGNLEVYFLIINDRRIGPFINDGSQRTRAACKILDNPEMFGLGKKDAIYLMRNTSYPVTEKIHRSHQEALKRFQIVNNNLALTPYQKAIGDLIYCNGDDHQDKWQSVIDEIHKVLYENNIRLVKNPYPNKKSLHYFRHVHLRKRHDLSLFLRFISQEKTTRDYKVSRDVSIYPTENDKYFELELQALFRELEVEAVIELIKEFERKVSLDTTVMKSAWKEVREEPNQLLHYGAYRWLLDVAIWARNNGVSRDDWSDFTKKFLKVSQGSSAINFIDRATNKADRANVTMSSLASLSNIAMIIESEMYDKYSKRTPRRANGNSLLESGYDNSHVIPFVENGDGPTFSEPASLNRARGAKEVDMKEI